MYGQITKSTISYASLKNKIQIKQNIAIFLIWIHINQALIFAHIVK